MIFAAYAAGVAIKTNWTQTFLSQNADINLKELKLFYF